MRSFRHHSSFVRVDPRGQLVRAELADGAWWAGSAPGCLHPSVASAGLRGFVPALALMAKAKRFDDRFVAAMDLRAHEGDDHLGWAALLEALRSRVDGSVRGLIDAARSFMGDSQATDGAERLAMRKRLRDFEGNPSPLARSASMRSPRRSRGCSSTKQDPAAIRAALTAS